MYLSVLGRKTASATEYNVVALLNHGHTAVVQRQQRAEAKQRGAQGACS